eukprot:g1504.t1
MAGQVSLPASATLDIPPVSAVAGQLSLPASATLDPPPVSAVAGQVSLPASATLDPPPPPPVPAVVDQVSLSASATEPIATRSRFEIFETVAMSLRSAVGLAATLTEAYNTASETDTSSHPDTTQDWANASSMRKQRCGYTETAAPR